MVEEENRTSEAKNIQDTNKSKIEKLKAGLFLTAIASFGILSGFGYSLSSTKKKETKEYPKEFEKKLHYLHQSGAELARKALFRATLYSVTGFSLFCFSIWKLSGANTFDEFRQKAGNILPKIGKEEHKKGRTEFNNLTELLQFLIDQDKQKKTGIVSDETKNK